MPITYTILNNPLIKKVIITFNYLEESSLGGGNKKQAYIKHAKKIYYYILQKILGNFIVILGILAKRPKWVL